VFKFISALVEMPKECEKYRVHLIIEYNRVLAWGKAAGLLDSSGSTLAATLGTSSIELVAIVSRIQWVLSEFRDLNSRYANELPVEQSNSKPPTDIDVLKKISNLAVSYEAERKLSNRPQGTKRIRDLLLKIGRHTKEIVTHPLRVRWVAVDREAFEALLVDLHALTGRLYELTKFHQENRIADITAKTHREMILARNDIQELRDMFEAFSSRLTTSPSCRKASENYDIDSIFQDLVRLKKLSVTLENILARVKGDSTFDTDSRLLELQVSVRKFTAADLSEDFEWNEPAIEEPQFLTRPRGILYAEGVSTMVWIEWKCLGDVAPDSLEDKQSTLRTVALAEMLHSPKPASLHVPECIGYFDDRNVWGTERFGWIFKMNDGSDCHTRVISLHDILGNGKLKPSLSTRIKLAFKLCSTVLNLHAVNWLHKGIFSDNVVFHLDGVGGVEERSNLVALERPLLTGFEFSRPDGTHTTARDTDVTWDLYRWPAIQREKPTERNSKKTYDLYSLGLLLLEIAHWERLDRIMLLGKNKDRKADANQLELPLEESKAVRGWLLGIKGGSPFEAAGWPNPLEELHNIAGDRYWKAVKRCLWTHGERGFGVEESSDQSNPRVGILLQEAFTKHVVEELGCIHV
jgi:hypothetical protein